MQIKKVAQKIAAISTGALMLGATLTGALAAYDLAKYPAPFVNNGVLDNTVIVVGKSAQTSDVMGAIDLAAALQADAVSKETVSVATSTAPTVSDGVKIEKSGDKFNYGEDIFDVTPETLDENDLPTLLADGTFKDTKGTNKGEKDYQQELVFLNNAGDFAFDQPDDMDAGSYFEIAKNDNLYNYSLRFDSGMTFSTTAVSDDLEGNTLEIQGKTYTITEAGVDGTGILNKIKIVAGDSTVWLVQDQPYTVGKHTVTVVDVDTDSTKCGINVDGVTKWVDVSTTEDFGDLSVGVLEAVAVNNKDYNADTCEVTLGSNEITLEEGEKVNMNGVDVEGSSVDFRSATAGSFTGFSVLFTAGKEDEGVNSDDIFMEAGDEWYDPVFGNFKILFEGTTADFEKMNFKANGDDATFTFVNNDGKAVELPFYYNDSDVQMGTASDEPLLLPGMTYTGDPEGVMLLYTTSGGESHVLEITDVTCGSSSTNKTTIKDVTYGNEVAKDKALTTACGASEALSLGSLGTLSLNFGAAGTQVAYAYNTANGAGTPESKYEGTFVFRTRGYNTTGSYNVTPNPETSVQFTEKAGDEMSASALKFNLTYDGSDDEITIDTVKDDGAALTWYDVEDGDSDIQKAVSAKGSLLTFDNDEKLSLEIMAPEEDVFANVFVTPLSGKVSGGSSTGGVTADKVNPFTVGLAVLDESAAGMTKNMIVVGGPAVNTVAAELLGNPANPAEGFSAGKAKIKFFDRKGKAALLVAGYDAQDTVGAAYVLASHNKYALSGDEVEVVVTSLDQITVNKV